MLQAAHCITKGEQNTRDSKTIELMEHSQPVSRDTPSNVRDIILSADRFGTWFAETIRASGRVRRANRPDTRLLLTSAKISLKNVLLCSSYPHKSFVQRAAFSLVGWRQCGTDLRFAAVAPMSGSATF